MTLKDCVETPRQLQHRLKLIRLKTAQCFDTNRLQEYMPKENIDKVPYEKFALHQMRQGEFPRPQSSHKNQNKDPPCPVRCYLNAPNTLCFHRISEGQSRRFEVQNQRPPSEEEEKEEEEEAAFQQALNH